MPGDTGGFQAACAAIVALYAAVALARAESRAKLARRLLLLAAAAWAGEDGLMRAYDAYAYSPSWSGFLDRAPVLIPCIWPVVVHSAWELARRLAPAASPLRMALVAGALVFTDALFIEPIAVSAGLWRWTLDGPFGVPLVGVLGWASFASGCVLVLEACERRGAPWPAELAVLVVGPLAAHALTVASWWALLRWTPAHPPETAVAAAAWAASLLLAGRALRRTGGAPLAGELLLRVPGASMFAWLIVSTPPDAVLVVYALAFVPPYVALLAKDALSRARGAPPRGSSSP